MLLPAHLRQSTTRVTRPKSPKACPKHPNPAKAIEVKQTQVERQALRNFTMPLAVGKA